MEAIHPCSCGADDAMPVLEHRTDSTWYARVECDACDRRGPERQSMDQGSDARRRARARALQQSRNRRAS